MSDQPTDCEERHTPAPTGYAAWHDWAGRMSRTHHQTRCPDCQLYAIWVPKVPGAEPLPPTEGCIVFKGSV